MSQTTDPVLPPDVIPFRAGDVGQAAQVVEPSEATGHLRTAGPASLAAEAVAAAAAKTYLADVSEFQPDINDAKYLNWSKAIIIRAAYGASHDDRAWYGGDRRKQLHDGGVKFLGIYQYLVASQDPVLQARALIKLVGALQPGEKIICDLEEGGGNQHARLTAWYNMIVSALGDTPWTYSGLFFARDHGIAPVDWVAAYQDTEPSVPHKLWQFTDKLLIPGVGTCDCSVFNGTVDQLAAMAHQAGLPEGRFPAPRNLKAGVQLVSVPLAWDPVRMADGTVPTGYTVNAYGLDGKLYNHMVVPSNAAVLTGLRNGWTYNVHVWANGGAVAPPNSQIQIKL